MKKFLIYTEAECLHHNLPPIEINLLDIYQISPMVPGALLRVKLYRRTKPNFFFPNISSIKGK